MNIKNMDGQELLEVIMDGQNWHCNEGSSAVKKLGELCGDLGYNKGQFIGANPILNFLADNSGAIDALLEFIAESHKDSLMEIVEENGLNQEE